MFADRAKIYIRSGKGGDGKDLIHCLTTATDANTRPETVSPAGSADATAKMERISCCMYRKALSSKKQFQGKSLQICREIIAGR